MVPRAGFRESNFEGGWKTSVAVKKSTVFNGKRVDALHRGAKAQHFSQYSNLNGIEGITFDDF
jgi:hypothetical protein